MHRSSTIFVIISDWLLACVGSRICWASCSFHRTFNYSRPQITSRIQASLSRLPPPHVNALLLMPPSLLSFLPASPSPFGISADECWTVSCLRVACFFGFRTNTFTFWSLQMSWTGKHTSKQNALKQAASCLLNTHCWHVLMNTVLFFSLSYTHRWCLRALLWA